jgi:hypothetical protein
MAKGLRPRLDFVVPRRSSGRNSAIFGLGDAQTVESKGKRAKVSADRPRLSEDLGSSQVLPWFSGHYGIRSDFRRTCTR